VQKIAQALNCYREKNPASMCEGKLLSTHMFCLLIELAISTSIIGIQLDPLVERLQPCPSNQDQNQKKKLGYTANAGSNSLSLSSFWG
jgi:hypothetical protein